MNIDEWWPKLDSAMRDWLIAHNGEAVPAHILSSIEATGAAVTSDASWVGHSGPDGLYLSDEATDWVETVANRETTDDR
ncbi:hypothetical protein [Mycetocola sp. 2940]|uniref:hypothetical protein n=1 Tax=Mycetocola sp. 2940 TaxID=3156452 RepID=UPI003399A482